MDNENFPDRRAKQPLVIPTLLFLFGIAVEYHLHWHWQFCLVIALVVSLFWCFISWKILPPPWPIVALIFTAGAFLTASRLEILENHAPNHLKQLVQRLPQHLSLRGVVWSDPSVSILSEKERSATRKSSLPINSSEIVRFELKIVEVQLPKGWGEACGTVLVEMKRKINQREDKNNLSNSSGKIEFGQKIELEGVLAFPNMTRNFGLFNYPDYLWRMGIQHVFRVEQSNSIHVLEPSSWMKWIFSIRHYLAQRLTLGIEEDKLSTGIIRGMLLGYREDIPADITDAFRQTGTLHVFAISGSHISMIAFGLLMVLKPTKLPRSLSCWIVLPLLIFYVAATGLRASSIRSLIMACVIMIGWAIQRPSGLLNNLAASALIISIGDPIQLFDTGFQLSFVVVASVILLAPFLDRKFQMYFELDPYIPTCCILKLRQWIQKPCRWLSALLAVSFAAWIGSLGLNIYYFNLISIVSLLANLVIVPLASASVALALMSLSLGLLWDQFSITVNTTQSAFIHAMVSFSQTLADWDYGYFYIPQLSASMIFAGYIILVIMIGLVAVKKTKAACVCGAIATGIVIVMILVSYYSSKIRLDILDVGSGQCILISGPRFERLLFDSGTQDQGNRVVEPFLRTRGVNSIDLAIITRGDPTHYGGFCEIWPKIPIHQVVVADSDFRSTGYRQLLENLRQSHVDLKFWKSGNHSSLASGLITAHWPPKGDSNDLKSSESTLILDLETKFGSFIFTSDYVKKAEEEILLGIRAPCQILIQGLQNDLPTETLLQSLKPRIVVFNTAEYPLRAYPSSELQQLLDKSDAKVCCTHVTGGIIVKINEMGVEVQQYRSAQ